MDVHDNFKIYNYPKCDSQTQTYAVFLLPKSLVTKKKEREKRNEVYHTRRLMPHLLKLREILLISTKKTK